MSVPLHSPHPQHPAIPRTVWALGVVSLCMDVSSEIIHSLLPLFLTTTLGASVALVGFIDGVGESMAALVKVFSGYLSDLTRRRKPLLLLGYGLGALSKPLFPLAEGAASVLGARLLDRIGKGLRGAPRDALVAEITAAAIRGRAYGLRQAMDTVGALLGPLAAMALMLLLANDIRAVFWLAVIPGWLAVLVVLAAVSESRRATSANARAPIRMRDLMCLGAGFWAIVGVGVVFTLARFSEAFLILKAHAVGLPLALAPLVLVAMNIVYAAGAYPAGALSDRTRALHLLLAGLLTLLAADVLLAFSHGLVGTFAGICLWGAHMALTQGLFAKLVAENAPPALLGSAFGVYNFATGVALFTASALAGVLWEWQGPATTFAAGAAFVGAAAVLLIVGKRIWPMRA